MKNSMLAVALFTFLSFLFFFNASAQTRGWGSNHTGQLGIGSAGNYQHTPLIITSVPDATAIEGNDYHTIFLKADGTLAASGRGGILGDGTTINRSTPVPVLNLTNVTAVSAGVFHSLALKSDGTVWAWGSNSNGQLGIETVNDGSLVPVQSGAAVLGFNNIVAVAAGGSFSYALKADGTVWAWGTNTRGQLGSGTTSDNRNLPAPISTLSNVIAIQAGDAHGIALKSDGTVWAWGWNAQGEIGNGTWGWSGSGGEVSCYCYTTPTASLISGVSQIAAGALQNAALKSDGTVWVWGRNFGYSPRIWAISNVIEIDAGYDVTYARKRDGSILSWGNNEVGQLGIGTFQTPLYSPVQTHVGTNNAFVGSGYHHAYTGIPTIATPAGSNVRHYGENVNITFASVTAAGTTQYGAFDPNAYAPVAGFDIVENSRAYHLTTTAAFTSATVCLNTPSTYSEAKFNTLSLLHQENGIFVDRTVSRNYQRREICASVTSFSRFVLALPAHPTTKFDFDGDARADIAVFRPADGDWHLLRSATQDWVPVHFGAAGDKITPADFDGDGRTDISVFRDGTWYWLNSSTNSFSGLQFGIGSDIPVPADYTGDGRDELAVYRSGVWYTLNLANNEFQAMQFGISTDKTVPADYDADGKTDIAVYRDGYWYILGSSQGFYSIYFGNSTDKPVVGDYDGDRKTDAAVYRADAWHIRGSSAGYYAVQFGVATDVPAPADYDGDGKTDLAVFRQGVWYLLRSQQGFTGVQFGAGGDQPIPNAFVP